MNTPSETKTEIYTHKRDDEHPRTFHMGVPPTPTDSCVQSKSRSMYMELTSLIVK